MRVQCEVTLPAGAFHVLFYSKMASGPNILGHRVIAWSGCIHWVTK